MKVIVIGAGINGITATIELKRRGHAVTLVDPGPIPHPLAASTDINKAVRAAYGVDEFYSELAERAIPLWHEWNEQFGEELYHQTGVMFLRQRELRPDDFEYESWRVLRERRITVERLDPAKLRKRYPAWNADHYKDGIFESHAGYAESGRVVARLAERARSAGVRLMEGSRLSRLDENDQQVRGVVLDNGERLTSDAVVMAVGAWTPYLLPFTQVFFRATGHPVFHLKPQRPELFRPECFPVFGADISTTGYYGFPLNRDGVVKIANHGPGREMSPDSSDRTVTPEEERSMREFISGTFPDLRDAPIVYTRICLYCDTNDDHFWIAPDPQRPGLIVATGDSGHGFKFAPVLGQIIADAVEGKSNPALTRFRWRPEVKAGASKEAARFEG
jgi:glycine/D-amino acid oxidase-like deaminating enzyme